MDPPLTSVREFPEELGKHLAEFALRRIQQPDREPQQLVIPTKVIVRESTRALLDTRQTVARISEAVHR
jgi:DNA-binding LacI/PurR family transcriptional regulator